MSSVPSALSCWKLLPAYGRGLLGSAVFLLQLGGISGALIISGVQHDTAACCCTYSVTCSMGMGVSGFFDALCTYCIVGNALCIFLSCISL